MGFFAEKCVGCGACRQACAQEASCVACGACTETCPTQARKRYGTAYTVEELMEIIEADRPYFDATGGGVTVSGGECMLYPDFLSELAKRCHDRSISVAVDTAGNVPFSSFETVIPYTDLFLYDIKCLDPALHRKGTGVDNRRILENLDRLIECGAKLLIRIPCIPNFNEGEEVEKVKAYCEERGLPYEVLSYHSFGEGKKEALEQQKTPR